MIENLQIEDLPESLQIIAKELGLENLKKLAKIVGGDSIYIPTESRLLVPARNREIRKNYKGNPKELAHDYDMTLAQIRRILKEKS